MNDTLDRCAQRARIDVLKTLRVEIIMNLIDLDEGASSDNKAYGEGVRKALDIVDDALYDESVV